MLLKELIEAGAHFGHKTSQWNPKMRPYIFDKRSLVYIIDIRETLKGIYTACRFLTEVVRRNGEVLFVGIKRQAQNMIQQSAQHCSMHYVNIRWLGGTLTNFETIHLRLNKLLELEKQETDGTLDRYNKKEQSAFHRELRKLRRTLSGIRNMNRLPDALVVVDTKRSKNAIREARILDITTIGLVDTDGDPTELDIPIPVNDDSMKVLQIVMGKLAESIIEGKSKAVGVPSEEIPRKKEVRIVEKKPVRTRRRTEGKSAAKTKSAQAKDTSSADSSEGSKHRG